MLVAKVVTTSRPPSVCLHILFCVTVAAAALLVAPVDAITTKISPPLLIADNTSHASQFVQIRSGSVNQPTRAFLLQQKSALSPVQQTHILDDVQKNQRVHYQPSYSGGIGGGGGDGRPKMLLTGVGSSVLSPSSSTTQFQNLNNDGKDLGFSSASNQIAFEAAAAAAAAAPGPKSNNFVDFNPALPLQTVILSPQQSLPTSPTFNNEYGSPSLSASPSHQSVSVTATATVGPAHRQLDGSVSSASSSSHRIPFSTISASSSAPAGAPVAAAANAVQVGRQVSGATRDFFAKSSGQTNTAAAFGTSPAQGYNGVGGSGSIRYWPSASATPYSGNRAKSEFGSYTSLSLAGPSAIPAAAAATAPASNQYPKYEPAVALASSLSTTTAPKSYYAKDTSSIFSPHIEKPQLQHRPKYQLNNDAVGPSDKFVKEVYLKTNPEILIAKDRQKFFQQLLEGGKNAANQDNGGGHFELADAVVNNNNNNDDDDDEDNHDYDKDNDDDDQTVAQNNFGNMRSQFEKEFLRQLKQSIGTGADAGASAGKGNGNNNGNGNGAISQVGAFLGASNASANAVGISELNLPNGQKIQISKDYNRLLLGDNDSERGANNKIKAIVVKQLPSTAGTPKPNILEELTKGVVPPGAEFEVIKRNKDGALEEVSKLPQNIPQKKVTFVILEEQSDGTVRVQGVRGSEKESLKESGEEVDTIIKKIKEGELKLPPSTRLSPKQHPSGAAAVAKKHSSRQREDQYETKSKRKPTMISGTTGGGSDEERRRQQQQQQQLLSFGVPDKHFVPTPIVQAYATPESFQPDTYATTTEDSISHRYYSSAPSTFFNVDDMYTSSATDYKTATSASTLSSLGVEADSDQWKTETGESATSKIANLDKFGLVHLNSSGYIASLFSALKTPSPLHPSSGAAAAGASDDVVQLPFLPTTLGHRIVERPVEHERNSTSGSEDDGATSTPYGYETSNTANAGTNKKEKDNTVRQKKRDRNVIRKSAGAKKRNKETRKDNDEEESNADETKSSEDTITSAGAATNVASNENSTLSDVLKKEGFYAMARFLRQSGLDSILNDTGPFTLFIPTDKAFRTLLIQLGGPDKAEDKFKENPRLLSGLLLHHVIPGAFRVNSLQDEMTGVSLAGTQLRVNTYTTHDIEWNDITVVTVNGAKILDEKDIVIPQGIAHAIDRVMFPLPVGNLLQSLQADRENRYSNFLKILEESELSYLLTGGKTFTLFAPLNRAFTHAEFTKILADANESKSFVLRHVVPGALYSAGMKYYQVRDSMEDGQQITLYKEAGKIKVNNAHVVTRNTPASNGVIHAIDAFL